MDALIARARALLARAENVAVLCGAGVSAESGVPTFRGQGGLWQDHRPEDLATPQAFDRDPELVWRWYNWRRGLIAACRPNPAHLALARLQERKPGLCLITQNVDGLQQLAGSRDVIELHGSIWRLRCTACGAEAEDRRPALPALPRCAACGGLLRPGVVWFGEQLDPVLLERAWQTAGACQAMLVVGTSAVVQPVTSLAGVAKAAGAALIEVNLVTTANSQSADLTLLGPAGRILPQLTA
ncbi:SIR2 family NAD-dependent protein deacylase [Desulfarculus baarsii]